MSWNAETGEDFDCRVAEQRFNKVISNDIKRIKNMNVSKILFVWTNDFFNADGLSNSTTGGTPQDVDTRWQKLFLTGCRMLVNAIEELRQYAHVQTFYVASNHSRQVDFYALNYLYAWFNTYDDVYVDINCSPRYYFKFGNVLLGFAHGYYEKKNNLPSLMSIECSDLWSETKYREFHLAHYHSERVEEQAGIIFRWLPSVTGTDAWHKDCGYIGATKRSYSFVYNKDGLEAMYCTII